MTSAPPPSAPVPQPPAPAPPPAVSRPAGPSSPATRTDPIAPHLIWEGVLALLTIIGLAVLFGTASGGTAVVRNLLFAVAVTGVMASGLGFSLRTASPNLAVGAIASLTGIVYFKLVGSAGWPLFLAGLVALLIAAVIGLIFGAVTLAASVPGWAVTTGGALTVQGIAMGLTGGVSLTGKGFPVGYGLAFVLFVLVTLGGGALWLVPAVRRTLGAGRTEGDPGVWRLKPGIAAMVGMVVSSLLAGVAGLFSTSWLQQAVSYDFLMPVAFAAVLLGGTSVFGRRAGIAGTLLAVLLVRTAALGMELLGLNVWWQDVTLGVAVLIGLGVSRLLEALAIPFSRRGPRPGFAPVGAMAGMPGVTPAPGFGAMPPPATPTQPPSVPGPSFTPPPPATPPDQARPADQAPPPHPPTDPSPRDTTPGEQ